MHTFSFPISQQNWPPKFFLALSNFSIGRKTIYSQPSACLDQTFHRPAPLAGWIFFFDTENVRVI